MARRPALVALVALVACVPVTAAAAQPSAALADAEPVLQRAADVRPGPNGSFPRDPAVLDGILYLGATDGTTGYELWGYDASAGGGHGAAFLAADISPATFGSSPFDLEPLDGRLYFAATGPDNDTEVWRYDPATGQAARAANIDPSPASSFPRHLTALDGRLYLNAYTPGRGRELWVYDPATGVATVVNIAPGTADANPADLTALGGKLYFRAQTTTTNAELWVYDPATGTASVAADVNPGPEASGPYALHAADGVLYFAAYRPATGTEMYVYDPADDTVTLVAEVVPGATSSSLGGNIVSVAGRLYASADDGETGQELWEFDPVGGTARLVADVSPFETGFPQGSFPAWLTSFAGRVYFAASHAKLTGSFVGDYELWMYDPVANGGTGAYSLVGELVEGTPPYRSGADVSHLIPYAGDLYFAAKEPTAGQELWRYRPAPVEVAVGLHAGNTTNLPGLITTTVYLRNQSPSAVAGRLILDVLRPDGTTKTRTVGPRTFAANSATRQVVYVRDSAGSPLGQYAATLRLVATDGTVLAVDEFTYRILA